LESKISVKKKPAEKAGFSGVAYTSQLKIAQQFPCHASVHREKIQPLTVSSINQINGFVVMNFCFYNPFDYETKVV